MYLDATVGNILLPWPSYKYITTLAELFRNMLEESRKQLHDLLQNEKEKYYLVLPNLLNSGTCI